jgi:hypothetical protein
VGIRPGKRLHNPSWNWNAGCFKKVFRELDGIVKDYRAVDLRTLDKIGSSEATRTGPGSSQGSLSQVLYESGASFAGLLSRSRSLDTWSFPGQYVHRQGAKH